MVIVVADDTSVVPKDDSDDGVVDDTPLFSVVVGCRAFDSTVGVTTPDTVDCCCCCCGGGGIVDPNVGVCVDVVNVVVVESIPFTSFF